MPPHKLALYRWAVQHPQAEVEFLKRVYRRHRGEDPTLLKEDFAGTCAVATAWVQSDPECQAMAVDSDAPTLKWAWKQAELALFERSEDLHLVHSDVLQVASPKVDVVTSLNFSTFIYHDRPRLVAYFRHVRKSLRPGGVFIMDAYGGPGAWRTSIQTKPITPDPASNIDPFTYHWEQKACDLATGRVDCRIHFEFKSGRTIRNAFRYDWRLWTLPELVEAMTDVGFGSAQVWCDAFDKNSGSSDGIYQPVKSLPTREDFVAYVAGIC